MLSSARARIATGLVLVALALTGLGLALGAELIKQTRHHVEVDVFNVGGDVQVFVNCRQAAFVARGSPPERVDLGHLRPDDRVFISTTSANTHPSYGFVAYGDGEEFFREERGDVETLGFPAEANAVVFAKAFSAGGTFLGLIGCQPSAVAAVPGYVQSPDDDEVRRAPGEESLYKPPRTPSEIAVLGRWAPLVLAVLGIATAIRLGPIRRLAWSRRKPIGSAIALLATLAALFFGVLGVGALVDLLTVAGIAALLTIAILLLVPSTGRKLERAAGAGCS